MARLEKGGKPRTGQENWTELMPMIKPERGNGDRTPIIRSSRSNCVGTSTTKSPGKKRTSTKAESRAKQNLKANASGRTASAVKSSATIKPKKTRKVSAPTVQKAKAKSGLLLPRK